MNAPKCWTCNGDDPKEATICLDGYEEILCSDCWGTMSVFEKMLLFKLFTPHWDEDAHPVARAILACFPEKDVER